VPPPAVAPVPDPAPYCGAAQRWTSYLNQAPKLRLVSTRVRGGRPATVKLDVDKPAFVTLSLRRSGLTVAQLSGRFASGRRALRWRLPPRTGGVYEVHMTAKDLAGNAGAADGKLRVLRARARRR
jgi:hypothetical protein